MKKLKKEVNLVDQLGLPIFDELLTKLRIISDHGFVPTLKDSDAGVGFTGESLLGIEENNSKAPDYKDKIELKFRKDGTNRLGTLFTETPIYIIRDDNGRIPSDKFVCEKYGYISEKDGRFKLNVQMDTRVGKRGWRVEVNRRTEKIFLVKDNEYICYWTFRKLQERLYEKHNETVFCTANTEINGGIDWFHYRSVVHCKQPSFDRFLDGIEEGTVKAETAFSTQENGLVKNRGYKFRTKMKDTSRIFDYVSEHNLSPNGLEMFSINNENKEIEKMNNVRTYSPKNAILMLVDEDANVIFSGDRDFGTDYKQIRGWFDWMTPIYNKEDSEITMTKLDSGQWEVNFTGDVTDRIKGDFKYYQKKNPTNVVGESTSFHSFVHEELGKPNYRVASTEKTSVPVIDDKKVISRSTVIKAIVSTSIDGIISLDQASEILEKLFIEG